MNKHKLRAKMVLWGDTGAKLAKYLGISKTTFSKKINSKGTEFTRDEILRIKSKYELTAMEVDDIFFNNEVS